MGTNNYGFSVANKRLDSSNQNYHKYYYSTNNANTFTIDNTGAATLLSLLNLGGNIIGSGAALTNLNYYDIPNLPDWLGYAINTYLNSLLTYSILSIKNFNSTSTTTLKIWIFIKKIKYYHR